MNWVSAAAAAMVLTKAVDAPITGVTVYSDRARVTRSASVAPGVQAVEFPLLLDTVDPASIRVESAGADVRRVDIARVDAEDFPADEARALLAQLEKVDDARAHAEGERQAYDALLGTVGRMMPTVPGSEPLKPLPHLSPAGWGIPLAFLDDWSTRMAAKSLETRQRLLALGREAQSLQEKARILGGARRRSGFRVTATVSAPEPAHLSLSYLANGARWYPTYDIQLVPARSRVELSFYGRVAQETGEDWTQAKLTLSTAIPATSTALPKLATWKIGQRDRFIPTPSPLQEAVRPPPPAQPLPVGPREQDLLRQRLVAAAAGAAAGKDVGGFEGVMGKRDKAKQQFDFRDQAISGELQKPDSDADGIPDAMDKLDASPPPAPPPPSGRPAAPQMMAEESAPVSLAGRAAGSVADFGRSVTSVFQSTTPVVTTFMSLAPPGGYVAPRYAADLPASLAGGYALSYDSLRPETVGTGKTARVPLFAQSWPVTVERKLFPALTQDAFLVAELKSPSPEPLPGGHANLFVGADPAGVAQLKLVSPQESFTLPLGIDRAVKPVRNVKVMEAEKGLIGKDDLSEYAVTIEVANPYDIPIQTRIHDQWPLTDDKNVETKLLKTEPYALQDKDKGTLEWRVAVPPRGKTTVAFSYSIRRPKSWLLHQ